MNRKRMINIVLALIATTVFLVMYNYIPDQIREKNKKDLSDRSESRISEEANNETDNTNIDGFDIDKIINETLGLSKEPDSLDLAVYKNIETINSIDGNGNPYSWKKKTTWTDDIENGYINYKKADFDNDGQDEILVVSISNDYENNTGLVKLYMLEQKGDKWEKAASTPVDINTEFDTGDKLEDMFKEREAKKKIINNGWYGTSKEFPVLSREDIFLGKNEKDIFICTYYKYLSYNTGNLEEISYGEGQFTYKVDPIWNNDLNTACYYFNRSMTLLQGDQMIEGVRESYYNFRNMRLNISEDGQTYNNPLYAANYDLEYLAGYDSYPNDYYMIFRWVDDDNEQTLNDALTISFFSQYEESKGKIPAVEEK